MLDSGTTYADDVDEAGGGGGVTRESALKLGALGLVAGLTGFFPGRARAATIYPAPCKPGQGYRCGGPAMTGCGGPGSGCGCSTQYLGRKLEGTKSYCVDMNLCCESLDICSNGQTDCPPGYTCSNTTCCGEPVCLPPCGSNVPPAACCLTPAGQSSGNCATCTSGGTCDTGGFTQCGCSGPLQGSFCFTSAENTAVCADNMYCADVSTCTSSAQCGAGNVCIVSTGCNCAYDVGVCVPLCSSGTAPKTSRKTGGMTVAGFRV